MKSKHGEKPQSQADGASGRSKPVAGIFQHSGDVDQLVALGTDYASLPRLLFKGKAICEHSAGGKWLCLVSRGLERTRTAPVRASRLHEKNAGLTIATRRHPHAAFTATVRQRGTAPKARRAVDSLQGHRSIAPPRGFFFAVARAHAPPCQRPGLTVLPVSPSRQESLENAASEGQITKSD